MSNLCIQSGATANGTITLGGTYPAGAVPNNIRDDDTATSWGAGVGTTGTAYFLYVGSVTFGGVGAFVNTVEAVYSAFRTGPGPGAHGAVWNVALYYSAGWNQVMSGTTLGQNTAPGTPTLISTSGSWDGVTAIGLTASGYITMGGGFAGGFFHHIRELRAYGSNYVAPTVISLTADEISPTTARIHGSISDTGGSVVTTRGFDHGPTTGYGASYSTTGSFGIETFDALLSALPVNSPYHFRANAYNVAGWGYGSDIEFYTVSGDEEIKRMSRLVYDDLMAYWSEEDKEDTYRSPKRRGVN